MRCTRDERPSRWRDAKAFIDHILTDPDPAGLLDDPDPVFRRAYQKGLVVDFIGGDSFMDVPFPGRDLLLHACQGDDHRHPECQKLAGQAPFLHLNQWHPSFPSKPGSSARNTRTFCWWVYHWMDVPPSMTQTGCSPMEADPWGASSDTGHGIRRPSRSSRCRPKSTANKQSIPYLYDSLVYLHEQLGLRYINQNFIMEDTGCTQADYEELDRQMEKCTAYVLEHRDDLFWSMLSKEQFGYAHLSSGVDWGLYRPLRKRGDARPLGGRQDLPVHPMAAAYPDRQGRFHRRDRQGRVHPQGKTF